MGYIKLLITITVRRELLVLNVLCHGQSLLQSAGHGDLATPCFSHVLEMWFSFWNVFPLHLVKV